MNFFKSIESVLEKVDKKTAETLGKGNTLQW